MPTPTPSRPPDVGLSRNTVRAHLRAAEAALRLDLLTVGNGIHNVVHALDITAIHVT